MHPFLDSAWGWLLKTSAWVALFVAPAKATMLAVSFLVAGDLVIGIWASRKRGEAFSSAKLRQTVTKTLGYQLAVIFSFVTETYLLQELPVLKVVAGLIATTELTSILESISDITNTPFGELIKKLFNKKDVP